MFATHSREDTYFYEQKHCVPSHQFIRSLILKCVQWWRPWSLAPSFTLILNSVHITQKRSNYFPSEMTISSLGAITRSGLPSSKWLLVTFVDAQGPPRPSSRDEARPVKPVSLWSRAHDRQTPSNRLTKALQLWGCSIVPSLHLSLSPCHVLFLLLLLKTGRHIHEGSIINQSGIGWLPDGWVIIAIIDTGWYEPCYLGLMLLEFRSPTPSYHLVPWWIVLGKVVCTDTHLLPLILCTLLALLRLLPLA